MGGAGDPTQVAPPTVVPGGEPARLPERIGHYRIDGLVGVGGFGTVYRGVHRWLGVPGAIKVMRRHLPDRLRGAFLLEARRLARLRGHPAIAEIRDFGFYHDPQTGTRSPYFVTDLVPGGRDLLKFARAEGLSPDDRLNLFERLCEGVRHAHGQGVIHLDLKPANILVWPAAPGRPAQPRIIDFGVSRAADPGHESAAHEGLTGTLAYMSPEQTEPGAPLDARSDVYALGVVLYELLCDKPPYDLRGQGHDEVIETIRRTPPDLESAGPRSLPMGVRLIIQKAMSKSPGERYADAAELLAGLRAYRAGFPAGPGERLPIVRAAYAVRRAVARHPIVTKLAILIAAMAAGQWIAVPLLYSWTDSTGWFMARFSRAGFESFKHVVLLERTREFDAKVGFDPQRRWTVRREYAGLMRALKDVGPKAVVFDAEFPQRDDVTGADADFLKSVTTDFERAAAELRDAGIPVIVGVLPEAMDDGRIPPAKFLDQSIRTSLGSWGLVGVEEGLYPWTIALAILHGRPPAAESLTMATIETLEARAVALGERLHPEYTFDLRADRLSLSFFKIGAEPEAPQVAVRTPSPISYRVTGVRQVSSDPERRGPDGEVELDTVAFLIVRPPPLRAFNDATILLVDQPDKAALGRCKDKIVLVHYPAGEMDSVFHPTESFSPGHVHAAAIETMRRGSILRMPDYWDEWAILAFGAVLGIALPLPYIHRRSWWPGWAVGGAISVWIVAIGGVVGAAVALALCVNYIVNPLVVLFGMVVAAGLALAAERATRGPRAFIRGGAPITPSP